MALAADTVLFTINAVLFTVLSAVPPSVERLQPGPAAGGTALRLRITVTFQLSITVTLRATEAQERTQGQCYKYMC